MFPESPVAAPAAAKPHPNPAMKARIVQPAGGRTSSLQGGTGGTESLAQLGLVPQSVLLIKWAEADLNGELRSIAEADNQHPEHQPH
jgi:tether containing UBX domain for GLUT4